MVFGNQLDTTTTRRALGAAVALALLALGVVIGRASSTPSATPSAPAPSAPPAPAADGPLAAAGPARVTAGVPVGFPHTEAGAKAAAANYAAAIGSPLSLTGKSLDGLVAAIAVPEHRQAVRAHLGKAADSAILGTIADEAEQGQPYALRTVPLALKTAGRYSPDQVTVLVYSATYLAARYGLAAAGYGLGHYQLRWRDGDWKLLSQREQPQVGPIPTGYFAPSTGWQPSTGQSLDAVAGSVLTGLTGTVPIYAVR
ncbi:hypothetical protein GCM10010411_76020 [Actinomadura fulvescens]|uniref:DUF8175 domain-containing protein n=1 Tax=Actinomadura fulvescens TaxID=46160 RepID=A0ABN3QIY1_9ACTN